MLFSRTLAPSCSYCRYGTAIGGGEIACIKRGITSEGGYCRKFRYDPLKREPERPKSPVNRLPPELAEGLTGETAEAPSAETLVEMAAAERQAQAQALDEKLTQALAAEFSPAPCPMPAAEAADDGTVASTPTADEAAADETAADEAAIDEASKPAEIPELILDGGSEQPETADGAENTAAEAAEKVADETPDTATCDGPGPEDIVNLL
jgi:hypothetical protein